MSKFTVWLIVAVIVGFLAVNLFIAGLLSYWGVGINQIGPRHLRAGSVSGPTVTGGGPHTGK